MTTQLRFLMLFIWTAIGSFSFAQTPGGEISGKILDADGSPLPFANVVLYSKDSAIVKAGFSGDDGQFVLFPIAAGDYWVRATFTGYAPVVINDIHLATDQKLILPETKMAEVGTEVTGLQIQTERPLVTVKPDMLVFNVENTPNAIGENAFNLLRKAPGVMIDNNDNINLLGKSGVRVYIDGKQSPLSGSDLANFLKSIQSSQIESFEIITNPSSKWDAAGNAGIINIRMRRDKSLGANATLDLGYAIGWFGKYNGSTSVNYRNKHFSVFGAYSAVTGLDRNFMDFTRHQGSLSLSPVTVMLEGYFNQNFRAGFDYFIGKKSTIGVLASGFLSQNTNNNATVTVITPDATGVPNSVLNASNHIVGGNNNLNFNLNYKYDNSKGVTFNADADSFVPGYGGVEIGSHELVHIVADICRELDRVSHHETGAAIQGAHEPHSDDNGITAFDDARARTRQAIFGARAGTHIDMD